MGRRKDDGKFPGCLDKKLIDKKQSYRWLEFGDIKREREGKTVDQTVSMNYFKEKKGQF
jgi:hypothetical protein